MKLENEITVEVLETKENVIKSISSNGFKLLKEYDINDIYLVKKEFENCKNYNELLNNSILIRNISEKPNTRKLITYKQKLKSIIKNLNLPIKDENYYAKKAEDILNDKK